MIYGYGSFCTPQCATAYLIKENIDSSIIIERYTLLNYLYGKDNSINPSPNPYYTLNKFCGNLSIEEYRELIKTNCLYTKVDKPMTRIFPEMHEENEEILLGVKTPKNDNVNNRIYKVKMQNEPEPEPIIKNKLKNEKEKINPFLILNKNNY
jgi:hypothetical protein